MITARARSVTLVMFTVSLAGCSGSGNANAPATPNGPSSVASSAPTPSQSPAAVSNTVASTNAEKGACELLTSDEIKSVQGEAPQEKKGDERVEGGFIVSQCYYALPILSKSVVLTVTSAAEAGSATDLRNFWKHSFSREGEGERDRDKKAKDKDQKIERGEEREESVPPQKVSGIGEEAYWTTNRVGGALYALKQHAFIRISVGGPDDQNSKLKKSKTLAQKVLQKL